MACAAQSAGTAAVLHWTAQASDTVLQAAAEAGVARGIYSSFGGSQGT